MQTNQEDPEATKRSKTPIVIKHIGPVSIIHLTMLFNVSIRGNHILGRWKVGKIIPIVRSNKPVDQA